jgi:riboflavin synthase
MFTGLVQETGEIQDLRRMKARNGDVVTRITVSAKSVRRELKLGDSVAVSGVCLTAVEIGRKKFSADLADETLKRTSLNRLKKKSLVNLELPARPQDRLGGHIVQGHVDGTGTLVALT